MAINPVGAGPVSVPSVANSPVAAPTTEAAAASRTNRFPDSFEPAATASTGQAATAGASGGTDAASQKKEVADMIFKKIFDMAEKARKDKAQDNDPWKG